MKARSVDSAARFDLQILEDPAAFDFLHRANPEAARFATSRIELRRLQRHALLRVYPEARPGACGGGGGGVNFKNRAVASLHSFGADQAGVFPPKEVHARVEPRDVGAFDWVCRGRRRRRAVEPFQSKSADAIANGPDAGDFNSRIFSQTKDERGWRNREVGKNGEFKRLQRNAVALAHIAGFPEKAALNALATSSGGSRALIDFIPRVLAHDYSGRIKVGEFLDALGVALDAADAMDVTIPMVETAYQLYDLLSVVGGEEMNIQAVALLYEDEKTCSDYGLDWTLADNMQLGQDQDLHTETLEEYLRRNFGNDGGEDVELPGPYGNGPHDDGSFGGYPPMGGFFSRN